MTLSPEGKGRVMDEAMNWLRNNEVKPGDVDVDVLRAPTISGVPMPTMF
jgi:hypothetical protein